MVRLHEGELATPSPGCFANLEVIVLAGKEGVDQPRLTWHESEDHNHEIQTWSLGGALYAILTVPIFHIAEVSTLK